MTSNQIAYASQLENARHNQAYEEETNRHNVATEQLAKESNDISKEKNIIQSTYNDQMVQLQSDYNKWYSKYTEASTKKKLDLEQQGLSIKQQMNDITEAYNIRMGDISAQEVSVKKRTAAETQRHNVAMEIQAQTVASADWWFHDLEVREKQRANDINADYNKLFESTTKRGQNLTFDAKVLDLIGKSGVELGGFGFKMGIHGAPLSASDAFNKILGEHYGSKEKQQNSEGEREEIHISGPEGISVKRADESGQGRAISGRLR